jgi:hypothetical protein
VTVTEAKRDAQIEALIAITGAILAVLEIDSEAADLWPETMRKGTPDEIAQVTGELANAVSVSLFRKLQPPETRP